jgi:hypothetical protein
MKILTLTLILSFSTTALCAEKGLSDKRARAGESSIKEKKSKKWGDDLRAKLIKSSSSYSRF